MKHDRPVSELLDECARSLPEPFTRQEILAWFRRNYPDVPPNTVGARIFGLTESDAPSRDHYQFGGVRPVLQRVGPGLYRRVPGRPRQPALFAEDGVPDDAPSYPLGDVLLIGSVRTTVNESAPAREIYTGALFARRRRYAEASDRPWFVVSGRWGLVAPGEVVASHDVVLGDMAVSYRQGWAAFVVGQLEATLPAADLVLEIHAGGRMVDSLRAVVELAGATLVDPVDAHSLSETLAWYDEHTPDDARTPDDA